MIRDTWRAVLILVVGTLLLEAAGLRRQAPTPTVATQTAPPDRGNPVASGLHYADATTDNCPAGA